MSVLPADPGRTTAPPAPGVPDADVAFTEHTLDSAPQGSRRVMEGVVRKLGVLPSAVARLAESPELLGGFLKLSAMFEQTTLDPLARETVVMTVAVRNGCHVCVEMHSGILRSLDADGELVRALRESAPVPDRRLAAVRRFTVAVLDRTGEVGDAELRDFLAHGFTRQNALEVVMGIGTYTMSTFANRLVRAPLAA